jgi:hypothetical protein
MRTPPIAIVLCLLCLVGSGCKTLMPTADSPQDAPMSAQELIAAGGYLEALAVLSPLPRTATSEHDRHRLALAGEALLHVGNTNRAEEVLVTAVAGLDEQDVGRTWLAPALANLGKVRLANGKPDLSAQAYARAAAAFHAQGDEGNSAECIRMAQGIQRILGTD